MGSLFSMLEGYYIYVVEVPIVLAIVMFFAYIMYSLNLFRKD